MRRSPAGFPNFIFSSRGTRPRKGREPLGGLRMLVEPVPVRRVKPGDKMRIALVNVCETGHNVLDSLEPQVREFFERLGARVKIVAKGNLFSGVVDLSDLSAVLEEAIERTDAALKSVADADADCIVLALTGPYLVAYVVLERIRRLAGHRLVFVAQFDMASRKYVFIEDRRLFEILHTPFRGGVK